MEIRVSLKTFTVRSDEVYNEYKKICVRNNTKISDDLDRYMRDVIKNHSTGNDQMKIEQWVDNSNMKAVPAFNSKRETWTNYISKINPKELDEFKLQLEKISRSIPLTIENSEKYKNLFEIDGFIPRNELNKGVQAYIKKLEESNAD